MLLILRLGVKVGFRSKQHFYCKANEGIKEWRKFALYIRSDQFSVLSLSVTGSTESQE